jgi:FixJ family two-component response regulator
MSGQATSRRSIELLTVREREVVAGRMRDLTNKQAGQELGISHRIVEIHRARGDAKARVADPGGPVGVRGPTV